MEEGVFNLLLEKPHLLPTYCGTYHLASVDHTFCPWPLIFVCFGTFLQLVLGLIAATDPTLPWVWDVSLQTAV